MVNGVVKKAGGAGPPTVLVRDSSATASNNLTVLKRSDPDVEEVLGTAGHVCLYAFDVDSKQWVRSTNAAHAARSRSLARTPEPQGGGGLHVRRQAVRFASPSALGPSAHARSRSQTSCSQPRFQFIILNRLSTGARVPLSCVCKAVKPLAGLSAEALLGLLLLRTL
jgi:hypothetical protein